MINIVGLGPSDETQLTLEAIEIINNGNRNYLRTEEHDSVNYFKKNNIEYTSFDYIYNSESTFEEVYEKIVEKLLLESKNCDINYFVPGHPLIAEKTVVKILERTKDYNIVSGMSFIEPMLNLVKRDPSKGFILIDGDDFSPYDINKSKDIIITQLYNTRVAIDLKLSLSEIYSDEYEIYIVWDAGLKEERVKKLPLYLIDREEYNHRCAMYIPASDEINVSDVLKALEKQLKDDDTKDIDLQIDVFVESLKQIMTSYQLGEYTQTELIDMMYKKITL